MCVYALYCPDVYPVNDDSCESARGKEQDRASVIADRAPPQVLQAGEHFLFLMAQAIECRAVWDLDLAAEPVQDARRNSDSDQRVAKPIGIVAPAGQQSPHLRYRGQQSPRPM